MIYEIALQTRFSQPEWEWLIANPEFRQAMAALDSKNDVERLSILGDRLLRNADKASRCRREWSEFYEI